MRPQVNKKKATHAFFFNRTMIFFSVPKIPELKPNRINEGVYLGEEATE